MPARTENFLNILKYLHETYESMIPFTYQDVAIKGHQLIPNLKNRTRISIFEKNRQVNKQTTEKFVMVYKWFLSHLQEDNELENQFLNCADITSFKARDKLVSSYSVDEPPSYLIGHFLTYRYAFANNGDIVEEHLQIYKENNDYKALQHVANHEGLEEVCTYKFENTENIENTNKNIACTLMIGITNGDIPRFRCLMIGQESGSYANNDVSFGCITSASKESHGADTVSTKIVLIKIDQAPTPNSRFLSREEFLADSKIQNKEKILNAIKNSGDAKNQKNHVIYVDMRQQNRDFQNNNDPAPKA